eukprot:TRINITY_DN7278_c0_g1_i1.p1 TRINITY_DN7278_c0_g1~~TRINITY_DN7278_c0_g1_i1.p1  ORF type:complete len:541 (+),score=97.12 TRINITY_DN7278_c0_g1_i1:87-1709(+)
MAAEPDAIAIFTRMDKIEFCKSFRNFLDDNPPLKKTQKVELEAVFKKFLRLAQMPAVLSFSEMLFGLYLGGMVKVHRDGTLTYREYPAKSTNTLVSKNFNRVVPASQHFTLSRDIRQAIHALHTDLLPPTLDTIRLQIAELLPRGRKLTDSLWRNLTNVLMWSSDFVSVRRGAQTLYFEVGSNGVAELWDFVDVDSDYNPYTPEMWSVFSPILAAVQAERRGRVVGLFRITRAIQGLPSLPEPLRTLPAGHLCHMVSLGLRQSGSSAVEASMLGGEAITWTDDALDDYDDVDGELEDGMLSPPQGLLSPPPPGAAVRSRGSSANSDSALTRSLSAPGETMIHSPSDRSRNSSGLPDLDRLRTSSGQTLGQGSARRRPLSTTVADLEHLSRSFSQLSADSEPYRPPSVTERSHRSESVLSDFSDPGVAASAAAAANASAPDWQAFWASTAHDPVLGGAVSPPFGASMVPTPQLSLPHHLQQQQQQQFIQQQQQPQTQPARAERPSPPAPKIQTPAPVDSTSFFHNSPFAMPTLFPPRPSFS